MYHFRNFWLIVIYNNEFLKRIRFNLFLDYNCGHEKKLIEYKFGIAIWYEIWLQMFFIKVYGYKCTSQGLYLHSFSLFNDVISIPDVFDALQHISHFLWGQECWLFATMFFDRHLLARSSQLFHFSFELFFRDTVCLVVFSNWWEDVTWVLSQLDVSSVAIQFHLLIYKILESSKILICDNRLITHFCSFGLKMWVFCWQNNQGLNLDLLNGHNTGFDGQLVADFPGWKWLDWLGLQEQLLNVVGNGAHFVM